MKNRVVSALIAAVFTLILLCAALPTLAKVEVMYSTPSGYNDHDYQKLVTFLEQKDQSGVKNGKKINSGYSPTDPTTWADGWDGVMWTTVSGKKRVNELYLGNYALAGKLDVSGCTYLTEVNCNSNLLTSMDVSGCTRLEYLSCADCALTSLNASGCSAMLSIYADNNKLTSINVSGCTHMNSLSFNVNKMTSIDLSDCRALNSLACEDNKLTRLDLSHCPEISFDLITAEGDGNIGMFGRTFSAEYCCAEAAPLYDAPFLGWYTPSGTKISSSRELPETETNYKKIVAKFGSVQNVPGDANGDKKVDTEDALMVLRAALHISTLSSEAVYRCDMDYNGVIDTTDALTVLRIALGID